MQRPRNLTGTNITTAKVSRQTEMITMFDFQCFLIEAFDSATSNTGTIKRITLMSLQSRCSNRLGRSKAVIQTATHRVTEIFEKLKKHRRPETHTSKHWAPGSMPENKKGQQAVATPVEHSFTCTATGMHRTTLEGPQSCPAHHGVSRITHQLFTWASYLVHDEIREGKLSIFITAEVAS